MTTSTGRWRRLAVLASWRPPWVPLAPLVAGVRLSVTALSYNGQFVVSLLADDVFAELPVLADGVRATLTQRDLATTPREPWR